MNNDELARVLARIGSLLDRRSRRGGGRSRVEGPIFYRCRLGGSSQISGWREGRPWRESLSRLLRKLAREGTAYDSIELCLTHSFRTIDLKADAQSIANIHRGIRGIEIDAGGRAKRIAPTDFLARGLDFPRALASCIRKLKPRGPTLAKISLFEAHQFLIACSGPARVVAMHRGDQFVPMRAVTRQTLQVALDRLGNWFVANTDPQGRLPYLYDTSRALERPGENSVRHVMTTMCLGRMANVTGRADLRQAAVRNLQFNLDRYYHERDGLGAIEHDGTVKLGAIAGALLAIRHSPERARFNDVESRLLAAIEHLWNPDGSFRTFLVPEDRDTGHDYYPGEALLALAETFVERGGPDLLRALRRSIDHYQVRYDRGVSLAFIPWHTQAYATLWNRTGDQNLVRYIEKMNDRLVETQEWSDARYRDVRGRFSPHVSATAVYLEGLCDAVRVAAATGSLERAARYREALRRGLRNLIQLQFRDDVSQFYVKDRARTQGAFRTEVYDGSIRIDNNQHSGIVLVKCLEPGMDLGESGVHANTPKP